MIAATRAMRAAAGRPPVAVITDFLPLTSAYSCLRWAETSRRRTVQNIGSSVVELQYSGTTSNAPSTVMATLQPGQEWVESDGTVQTIWGRSQGGGSTGLVAVEVLAAG